MYIKQVDSGALQALFKLFKDFCFIEHEFMEPGRNLRTFQKSLLHPTS